MDYLPSFLATNGRPTKNGVRRMTALLKMTTTNCDVADAIRGEALQYISLFNALTDEEKLELFRLYELSPAMTILVGSPEDFLLFKEVLLEQKALD